MYFDPKVVDFFKKHNMYSDEMFNYFAKNTMYLDYNYPDHHMFIGCFPVTDSYNRLSRIQLNVPYTDDEITALINVHEITHGVILYPQLGKNYKEDKAPEVLPMLCERLYIKENPSEELISYFNFIKNCILTEEYDPKYKMGLTLSEELLPQYEDNLEVMQSKVKKLAKAYNKRKK